MIPHAERVAADLSAALATSLCSAPISGDGQSISSFYDQTSEHVWRLAMWQFRALSDQKGCLETFSVLDEWLGKFLDLWIPLYGKKPKASAQHICKKWNLWSLMICRGYLSDAVEYVSFVHKHWALIDFERLGGKAESRWHDVLDPVWYSGFDGLVYAIALAIAGEKQDFREVCEFLPILHKGHRMAAKYFDTYIQACQAVLDGDETGINELLQKASDNLDAVGKKDSSFPFLSWTDHFFDANLDQIGLTIGMWARHRGLQIKVDTAYFPQRLFNALPVSA